ncbi:trehalose-phosphatase [Nonomuraea sp. NPDC050310]|uniref:trehalose-phosphatase n=1 Tax=unclassified Nonomuraea TaxID=2593643 RepID=UPI0033CD9CCB
MLPTARTEAGRAGIEALVRDPGGALIGLDFDGTLAPIVSDPAQAHAHPGAAGALGALAGQVGTIVVITGRPVAHVLTELPVPGLVVLGHYGAERWEAGELSAPPPHPGVERARAELGRLELPEGATVEDKGRSVAVHTRRAADPAGAFDALRAPLDELARETGLVVEPGRFVLELRPPGMDKGRALLDFAAERGARSVWFAGDDLGDLAAFAAVDKLRAGGVPGVTVASSSDEVGELAARADLVVPGPDGVVAALQELANRLASDHG